MTHEMSKFAHDIMEQKYSKTHKNGRKETWLEISHRVAQNVLESVNADKTLINSVAKIISERKFIPGGRYLHSAGNAYHQINNCFLFRAEDSREGWAELLEKSALALMVGGGIGVNYSQIRPWGAKIRKTGGTATGPIALMEMLNCVGRGVMAGGTRRCLPMGSLVHTERGLVRIEEIIPFKDKVLTFDGYRKVTHKFQQGEQSIIKIITQMGEFFCTPNHRVAVLTSLNGNYIWKQAKDLEESDRLISTNVAVHGHDTELPPSLYVSPVKAHTVKEIIIPDFDEEMAWFIGYFQGNGHSAIRYSGRGKRNGVISVSCPTDAKNAIELSKKCMEKFGVNVRIRKGDGECFVVKANSVPLAQYMQDYIKVSKECMNVPDFILNGSKDIRAAFLAGIFDSDGSKSRRPLNLMSCVHKPYLQQLQSVASSLGIVTYFGWTRPELGNWKSLHHLNVKCSKQEKILYNTVGKFVVYKKFLPHNRSKEMFSYSFPPMMVKNYNFTNTSILHKNYKVNFPLEKIEAAIGYNLSFTPIQVLGIEDIEDNIKTYDIEVEERNEFFCNGYLVHNSAIWSGLSWRHLDIFKFIEMKNWTPEVRALKRKDFSFPATMDGTNISVCLDDGFFEAYHNEKHNLHSTAHTIYWAVIKRMLKTSEPGFSIDCGKNTGEDLRNACCELVSRDDTDVCNLGSINLSRIDSIEEMKTIVELATAFLLAGTVYSDVPFEKVAIIRNKNRRLGLGLMGVHEWLLKKGKIYGPDLDLEEYLKIYMQSDEFAKKYAKQWSLSVPKKTRAIAPTGTIGIIGETSTSMEPIFCVAYKRRYLKHKTWHYQYVIDPTAKRLIDEGIDPESIEDAYGLANDVERRIEFQVWMQQYVDHSISSTINLPKWGTQNNNEDTVLKFGNTLIKYLPKLRGLTVYADGSRDGQPLVPVKYETAIKHIGNVFVESTDMCDITKGGSCGE